MILKIDNYPGGAIMKTSKESVEKNNAAAKDLDNKWDSLSIKQRKEIIRGGNSSIPSDEYLAYLSWEEMGKKKPFAKLQLKEMIKKMTNQKK